MASNALKALVAAIQPGADTAKVAKISKARDADAMKRALADILNVPADSIDSDDANTVLAITKASIPSGGVVPLY